MDQTIELEVEVNPRFTLENQVDGINNFKMMWAPHYGLLGIGSNETQSLCVPVMAFAAFNPSSSGAISLVKKDDTISCVVDFEDPVVKKIVDFWDPDHKVRPKSGTNLFVVKIVFENKDYPILICSTIPENLEEVKDEIK